MKTSILKYLRNTESTSRLKYFRSLNVKYISYISRVKLSNEKSGIENKLLGTGIYSVTAKKFSIENEKPYSYQNRQNLRKKPSFSSIYRYRTITEFNEAGGFQDYNSILNNFELNVSSITKEQWEDIYVAVSFK